jgi:hypothetical protein
VTTEITAQRHFFQYILHKLRTGSRVVLIQNLNINEFAVLFLETNNGLLAPMESLKKKEI